MYRRRFLGIVGGAATVAGCLGQGKPAQAEASPNATEPPTPTPTQTGASDTPDFSCTSYKPIAGMDLSVSEEIRAHLTVKAVESGRTVVDREVSGGERVVFHGSNGVFEPRTDYRVVIRAGGSVRWNQTIYRTEKVRLTVEQNGSVTVEATIVEDTPTPCPN